MSLPILALHPDAEHREWVRQFTWHLDIVPPLMDALVTLTLPSIKATRTDKVIVTGGGHIDNMRILDTLEHAGNGQVISVGAIADARELWTWIVEYTRAAEAWIGTPTRPAPTLDNQPNADPLSARAVALLTVGWLIDHADHIEPLHELDEHRDAMFTLIRRLRGRYGVHRHPRRARPAYCATCGEHAVVIDWVPSDNGSPKPIQVGKCRTCGQTYTEGAQAPIHENGSK